MAAFAAANRDPAQFPEPDVLDLSRQHSPHLAFGHGVHQCLGQQLARVEMKVGFTALLERFPSLRLAVPLEQVRMRDETFVYGSMSCRSPGTATNDEDCRRRRTLPRCCDAGQCTLTAPEVFDQDQKDGTAMGPRSY